MPVRHGTLKLEIDRVINLHKRKDSLNQLFGWKNPIIDIFHLKPVFTSILSAVIRAKISGTSSLSQRMLISGECEAWKYKQSQGFFIPRANWWNKMSGLVLTEIDRNLWAVFGQGQSLVLAVCKERLRWTRWHITDGDGTSCGLLAQHGPS